MGEDVHFVCPVRCAKLHCSNRDYANTRPAVTEFQEIVLIGHVRMSSEIYLPARSGATKTCSMA